MKLVNLNNKILIAKEAKIASGLKDQLFGLLIKENPRALIFYTNFGIHSFGMKENIDLIVLNSQKKVVKLKASFKPNNVFFWNPIYGTLIELPEGTIRKTKTKIGDRIALVT